MNIRIDLSIVLTLLFALSLAAAEKEFVPKPGEFPPANAGHYFAGELVAVDHINRRGALRLIGDNDDNRYHSAPSHRFAMLPYGTLRYHGAPAELRDIPIGTLLHGYFVLPPEGDTSIPQEKNNKYVPPYNHALTLEDDFSFYQRQERAWKIAAVDVPKGKLTLHATGPKAADGLQGEKVFELDASTRIWKGRQIGELKDLQPEQNVQVNLSWAPDWKNGEFHVTDVWLDEESRKVATELQRQVHIRHVRHRWLAGWVDHVEHEAGGKGVVTVTLFGGADASLYDVARQQGKPGGWVALAAAENTLRSWWQEHDNKSGPVVEMKENPNPPPGSSGLQFRVKIHELLEGYRPGRIVRFRPNGFPNVKLPAEERVQRLEDR